MPIYPSPTDWFSKRMDLARNLKIESVARLQPPPAVTLPVTATVGEAAQQLRQRGVGCVAVLAGTTLVGVFTERDLIRRVLEPGLPLTTALGGCMTAEPQTVRRSAAIATAIRLMESGGFRHLPVVDERGQLQGMLSMRRIAHYLVEHFPATVHTFPRAWAQRRREGA